jgi:hypothetical protein
MFGSIEKEPESHFFRERNRVMALADELGSESSESYWCTCMQRNKSLYFIVLSLHMVISCKLTNCS